MYYLDREEEILKILKSKDVVENAELSSRLYVSMQTIRRDLDKMEEKGLVIRRHGAVSLNYQMLDQNIPFEQREQLYVEEKQIIAAKAMEFVRDNDVVFLDGATTAAALVPSLASKKNLIVVTNGAKTALRLSNLGIRTISTGGRLLQSNLTMVGSEAIRTVKEYNANVCFFSSTTLTDSGHLTDNWTEITDVRRAMMEQSELRVFLCVSDKFGKRAKINYAHLSEVDEIIAETDVPEEYKSMMRKKRL